jgi:leucyl-tRNA synthetase
MHKTVKKVAEDIRDFRFNTAVSALMIFANEIAPNPNKESVETLLKLLAPFAPHLSEECWEKLGHADSIFKEKWPTYDPAFVKDAEVSVPVQVNGKHRATVIIAADATEDEVKAAALAEHNVHKFLNGRDISRVVYVPGRLLNVVVKE